MHSSTCIYNVAYHLIWCPKYQRKVLVGKVEKDLRKLLKSKSKEVDTEIQNLEILPDHVHVFIKAKPTASPNWIVQQLKGYTSRILREKYPHLKSKLPSLWTRSYYLESVGHISEDTIKRYIEEQKGQ